ncbi:MAG: MBL fold metallo-hydrolase [Lachnospiraceae bacterium]|nr:MBL fold metallo-hydrolase [Lachnospiraceae bacterium]
MNIVFIGATHEVTGSCTLLDVGGKYYIVDFGMEQGKNYFENVPLPVSPSDIEAVFLTHAHIDHSGMLPKLVKDGFKGPIYATEATCNLCDIMLRDSAHIQMQEAEWKDRKSKRAGGEAVEPVYDLNDAECAVRLLRRCDYGITYSISENVAIRFTDIGHLLGSAAIEIWLTEGDVTKKIVFSGDVGNHDRPIIKDPQTLEEADYLVIESTYGDRDHEEARDTLGFLAGVIDRTLSRGGNVVIPAFAVGRTQEILYALREIKQRKMVKSNEDFPVYLDSPLASDATAIFMQCSRDYFDEEMLKLLDEGVNPIWFSNIQLSVTAEDSKAINFDPVPKVIISASGMCDAGRVKHHLKHNLWRKECTVLFVGYQAAGTLGRSIIDGAEQVTIFGEKIAVNAEITQMVGASGHADRSGLKAWADAFVKKPELVFVNHGDDASCVAFAKKLHDESGYEAVTPFSGTEYDLKTGEPVVITEGIPIVKEGAGGQTPAESSNPAFRDLVTSTRELEALIQSNSGRTNSDMRELNEKIRELIESYKL